MKSEGTTKNSRLDHWSVSSTVD